MLGDVGRWRDTRLRDGLRLLLLSASMGGVWRAVVVGSVSSGTSLACFGMAFVQPL